MEELDADVPTCSNSLTATEADAALRKQKRKKHKMKLAEKSRRKVEKYIEKLQAKLDELECREVDLLADDYDDAKEERRYKLMALLTKKLFRLREQLAKSFPERYEAKVGRDAVEDKLIILGTGSQALNDALTEFVNRPPSLKRRHLSAELGNNYCQHFNLPKPEEVREMVDKLIIVHPDKFSKDPIEIEQLINSAVDTVYKQVKGRRVEDHKMAIEEFEEWAKEHGDQEPSAEALSLVNEARPVTLRPVSFSTFQEAILDARQKGELDDSTADEGDGDDATIDDREKDASEGEETSDDNEGEEGREDDTMSTSTIGAADAAGGPIDEPISLSSDGEEEGEEKDEDEDEEDEDEEREEKSDGVNGDKEDDEANIVEVEPEDDVVILD